MEVSLKASSLKKITYPEIKEYLKLVWVNLIVQKRNFLEFIKVAAKYYFNFSFFKADLALILTYLFDNPFTISKRFLMKKGESDVYAYGETPLTTLDLIAKQCRLDSSDTVYELGCGRGRTCFWLNSFIGCKVVGIEYVPDFVERANKIKKKFHFKNIEFRNENIIDANFEEGTVFYLYGTCLEDSFIKKLAEKLSKLPIGTKIITVSYPLTDYTSEPQFEVMKRFPAKFTWGMGDVYLQIKK